MSLFGLSSKTGFIHHIDADFLLNYISIEKDANRVLCFIVYSRSFSHVGLDTRIKTQIYVDDNHTDKEGYFMINYSK